VPAIVAFLCDVAVCTMVYVNIYIYIYIHIYVSYAYITVGNS
jgi:hypothetical protein